VRRHGDDVEERDERRRVRPEAEKPEVRREVQAGDARLCLAPRAPLLLEVVAEHHEGGARAALHELPRRLDVVPDALDLDHLTRENDGRPVVRQLESRAAGGALRFVRNADRHDPVVQHHRTPVENPRRCRLHVPLQRV
jgi:hypothetical protein